MRESRVYGFILSEFQQKIREMSSALDKAMMVMSLEKEEESFDMSDLLQFFSNEKNVSSLMGRLLNPDCQKMTGIILDMPRKW